MINKNGFISRTYGSEVAMHTPGEYRMCLTIVINQQRTVFRAS